MNQSFFYNITLIMFLSVLALKVNAVEINIIHFNDSLAQVEESDTSIGFAKLATFIKKEKNQSDNTIVIDAGNSLYGSSLVTLSRGKIIIDIFNEMGVDIMNLGKSDYNYGINHLKEAQKISLFNIISANLITNSGNNIFPANKMFNFDGVRIGVFGITQPDARDYVHYSKINNTLFLSPKDTAIRQVEYLKNQGADIVIAVAQLGLSDNTNFDYKSSYLTDIHGLDLIVDGSSMHITKKAISIDNTSIVQAGGRNRYIGKVTINIENEKTQNQTVSIDSEIFDKAYFEDIKEDSSVRRIVRRYSKDLEPFKEVVAETPYTFYNNPDDEMNIGDLVAEAVKNKSRTDISFINFQTFTKGLPEGQITKLSLLDSTLFEDTIVTFNISGSDIKRILEHSASLYASNNHPLLYSYGISYTVSSTSPPGTRVHNIRVNDEPLIYSKNYNISTTSYLSSGSNGYTLLVNKRPSSRYNIRELVDSYLKEIDWTTYSQETYKTIN